MRRTPWLLGSAALVLAALVAAPAATTVIEFLDVYQMSQIASVVAVGEVERIEADWNQSHSKIYTRVTVRPTELLKGDQRLGSLTIKMIGGTIGDTRVHLPGTPPFAIAERVVLFLEPRDDEDGYLVIGLFQGKFSLRQDQRGGDEMLYQDIPPRGVTIIDKPGHPASSRMFTLSEVRRIVKGGGR
jgi:hypothetical protein